MRIVFILMAVMLSACGPSCEEQHGHWEQQGFYYVYVITDPQKGVGFTQIHPNFVCVRNAQ